jgi:hypothetical protein
MGKTKIVIALLVFCVVQFYGRPDLIGIEGLRTKDMQYSDRFDSKNQRDHHVGTIKMSYAECREGILKSNTTIVLSMASRTEVVHSFKEAKAFLNRTKDKPRIMVMFPNLTPMKMDETFCDQSPADKNRLLLAAVQT